MYVNTGVIWSINSGTTVDKQDLTYLTASLFRGLFDAATALYGSLLPALTQGTLCFSLTLLLTAVIPLLPQADFVLTYYQCCLV